MSNSEKFEPKMERWGFREYLAYFNVQRFQCIDDLPEKIVTLADPNYKRYKCITAWWTHVMGNCEQFLSRPDLLDDPEVTEELEDFLRYAKKLDFQDRRTRQDIDRANTALDKVIAHLEKKLGV